LFTRKLCDSTCTLAQPARVTRQSTTAEQAAAGDDFALQDARMRVNILIIL
jgi:hypothetical protein